MFMKHILAVHLYIFMYTFVNISYGEYLLLHCADTRYLLLHCADTRNLLMCILY